MEGLCSEPAGPIGHYSETINAIASLRPRFRRTLQGAWDVAYTWLRHEPGNHHIALPWQALLGVLTAAFLWGWYRVAGIVALAWGSISRIGEVLAAERHQLVLPSDIGFTTDYLLLKIDDPKTRFRGARHQVARLDQPDLLAICEATLSGIPKNAKLWPLSPQTLRKRFYSLPDALKLQRSEQHGQRGIDLGSLRAGGATWLLEKSENHSLVQRRGGYGNLHPGIIGSSVHSHAWNAAKQRVLMAVHLFPSVLQKIRKLHAAAIPENAWRHLVLSDFSN